MDVKVVDSFLAENRSKLFPNKKYTESDLRNRLLAAPDSYMPMLRVIQLQNPVISTAISIFVGFFGIDRFLVKEYILGILKLFTGGGYYIWWIIDIFTAGARCRKRNCEKIINEITNIKAVNYNSVPYTPPVTPPAAPHPSVPNVPVTVESDVFLSYSHRDQARLMPLFAALKQSGLKVWYDAGIRAGAEWEEEIIEQLSKSSSFLFFVSESSLLSANCRDELYQARKRNKKFVNVLIDNVDLSKPEFEWFDFRYSRYQQIPAYSMTTEEIVEKIKNGIC